MKKILYTFIILMIACLNINVKAESKSCKYAVEKDSLNNTYDVELNCDINGTDVKCNMKVGSTLYEGIKPSGHKAFPGNSIYNYSGDTYTTYLKNNNYECFPQMIVQYKITVKKNKSSVDKKSFYIDYISMDGWNGYVSNQGGTFDEVKGPYYYKLKNNTVVALAKAVGQNQQSNATCKSNLLTVANDLNNRINSYSEDSCRNDSISAGLYSLSAYKECENLLGTLKSLYTSGDSQANSCLKTGGISVNDSEYKTYEKASNDAKALYENANNSIECGQTLTKYANDLDAAVYNGAKTSEVEALLSKSQEKKNSCISAGYLSEESKAVEIYNIEYNQAVEKYNLDDSATNNNKYKPTLVCGFIGKGTFSYIKLAWNILKYSAPALVVILGMLDFAKVVLSGEDKDMKVAGQKFLKRIIAAVVLILLPILIQFIFSIANFSEDCLQYFK